MIKQYLALGAACLLALLALTSPLPAGAAGCPNEAARTGLSAALPDCRAYELVTPADTNGRLVGPINTFGQPPTTRMFPTELASPTSDSFVYMTYNSPLLSPGGSIGEVDLYRAERQLDGWQTDQRFSPSGFEAVQAIPGGVTSDHTYAFTKVYDELSSLFLGGPTDYLVNPDGSVELTGLGSLGDEPFAEGKFISKNGNHIIFSTENSPANKLEEAAPSAGTEAIYDRSADGPTKVVSLLPGDKTPTAGEDAIYKGTSKDGTVVAFAIKGILYVRIDNSDTKEVASGVTYAGLSDDGSFIFYVAGGNMHRFDTASGEDDQVNSSGDGQIMNVSADGSHLYFISKSQLDGSKGTAGQPNMYVWSGGSPHYIATVLPSDLERTSGTVQGMPALGKWTSAVTNQASGTLSGPGAESSRTTPDGTALVFESRAQLTTYDNDGRTAIYRYADVDKSLICVSCNPLTEPSVSDARLQELALTSTITVINNLTDDGSEVFFETSEALVGTDTDSLNDIYKWGAGEGAPTISLISSGKSLEYPVTPEKVAVFVPTPNVLLAVTPDGNGVFFVSQDALVPGAGEGGTQAIYDARVGGGFTPSTIPPACVEEGCRLAPEIPPSFLDPQSEGTVGSGNIKPSKRKRHCRRVSHKKHRRCAKNKAARKHARHTDAGASSVEKIMKDNSPTTPQSVDEASGPLLEEIQSRPPLVTTAAGPSDEFGIESVGAEESTTAAGMHPDFTADITLNHTLNEAGFPVANDRTEEISIALPPGLLGNPNALPECKTGQLVAWGNCPIDSQIGVSKVLTVLLGTVAIEPVYNLEPPHPDREIARFGISVAGLPVFIDVNVRTAGDFGATATVHSSPALTALVGAETTIWGNPADASHDKERLTPAEATECPGTACKAPGGKRESGLPPTAFLSNSSACQSQEVGFSVKSYQLPGKVFSASVPMEPTIECSGLPFAPTFEAQPTSRVAGAPTGLKTTLVLPQASTEAVNSPSTATMREAVVTLPEGMTVAAGAADGLEACSDAQVGYHEEVDAVCPDASKLGTATITSPYLTQPLEGAVYQRTPRPGHLFGLWLVTDELGLHVKIPGEIEPNPNTGQLTAVFSDLPQVPVGEIALSVWGGPRAPLKNPDSCGTYATSYTFAPHSNDPAVAGQSQMTIDEGCNTGGFSPKLHAGVTNPIAGSFSPFVLDLTREDGEQNLASLAVTLPDGELAKLAGVPLCPDDLATSGNCPVDSKIGSVTVATGPGPQPLWLPQPGKAPTAVYLAGPYKGAPFSVVTVVPAQAGPFDLGVVSVRSALEVDPETAKATIRTDPLPQFIEGVAAIYRRVHAVIDRPNFSLNPTDCSELAVTSAISSTKGAVASPTARFQVDGCKALKYTPKLKLTFKGGTKRSDHPAVKAVLTQPPNQANTAKATVLLPASEFIDQDHINNPCTRVQFREGKCPKLSILGRATAITSLLDKPLKGPVYFRSNGGDRELPDIVADLRGQIHVSLVGFVDAVHKKGSEVSRIRTRFMNVPDAPVTKFTISLLGGEKRGLLENSRNLCKTNRRAKVAFAAQNGRRSNRNLLIETSCDHGK